MNVIGARGTHRRFVQAGLVLAFMLCASCEARKDMIAAPGEVGGRTVKGDVTGSSEAKTAEATATTRGAALSYQPGETVVFTIAPPVVGDRYQYSSTAVRAGEVKSPQGTERIAGPVRNVRTVEILAVQDDLVRRYRTRYSIYEDGTDPAEGFIRPIVGKWYVIEYIGVRSKITAEGGGAVDASEEQFLVKEYKQRVGITNVMAAVAAAPLRIGSDAPEVGAAFAKDRANIGQNLETTKMRLVGRVGDIARFEYELEGEAEMQSFVKLRARGVLEISISTSATLRDTATMLFEGTTPDGSLSMKVTVRGEDVTTKL
ncbi:MAG: hypothetical protein HOW73_14150 [Polyangiaceae bacterium]|nr:hypothetical protein [Polyangiaceae bacterium]